MGELWNYRCGNTTRYEEFLVLTWRGIVDDSGYEISGILCEDASLMEACLFSGGRRRRGIIRRYCLVIGLFIVLRRFETRNRES